jgi:ribosome-associated heat shock protein Hsp15
MPPGERNAPANELRIDRWLWCARFFKSRSVAAEAVRAGHVRLNGSRVKPAHEVHVGDMLAIERDSAEHTVTVAAIPSRRGPSAEAQACYSETAESIERRRRAAADRAATAGALAAPTPGRPDKRTRRLLLQVRQRR